MKTMILDTSSAILYLSFYDGDNKIYEVVAPGKNNHSENLIKYIDEGLKELNLEVKDFERIIVGIGPGSYTGLRVSLTVAKTFSWTNNIPLYIASSLDILASGYFDKPGMYAITNRAKKDYLYAKLVNIDENNEIYKEIIIDSFIKKDEFFEEIEKYNYVLIDETNFLINPLNLKISLVENIHQLTPNYLQKEI
jgi:tRNA threonylcarbamoyladenosine biosynthesis protein TsaB